MEARAQVNVQKEHAYRDCPSRSGESTVYGGSAGTRLTHRGAYTREGLYIDKPVGYRFVTPQKSKSSSK